jgi:hypothetical protein
MSATAPLSHVRTRPATVERATPTRPRSAEPLHHLDLAVAGFLGADIRLIYGLAVPVLLVVAAMLPMFFRPSYWLVGALMVLVVCCVAFIVTKVMAILDAPDTGTAR